MELIENHQFHAIQGRILNQAACKYAFGQNLQAGKGRHPLFEAYLVAHGAAHRLAELRSQTGRNLPCGYASWLQHQDLALVGVKQMERKYGGFTGTGRSRKKHYSTLAQTLYDLPCRIDQFASDCPLCHKKT